MIWEIYTFHHERKSKKLPSALTSDTRRKKPSSYDGYVLFLDNSTSTLLLTDFGTTPKQVITNLSFRGVDSDNLIVEIIHRDKHKSLKKPQRSGIWNQITGWIAAADMNLLYAKLANLPMLSIWLSEFFRYDEILGRLVTRKQLIWWVAAINLRLCRRFIALILEKYISRFSIIF